jgi:hypothetical protein
MQTRDLTALVVRWLEIVMIKQLVFQQRILAQLLEDYQTLILAVQSSRHSLIFCDLMSNSKEFTSHLQCLNLILVKIILPEITFLTPILINILPRCECIIFVATF